MIIDALGQYFEHYGERGWSYEKLDESTLASGFKGTTRSFQFFVKIDAEWVYFVLVPFIKQPEAGYKSDQLRFLLRLNYEMNLVKSGIDEDGDAFLAVEFPVNDLDYEHFSMILDLLSYYADKYDQYFHQV